MAPLKLMFSKEKQTLTDIFTKMFLFKTQQKLVNLLELGEIVQTKINFK